MSNKDKRIHINGIDKFLNELEKVFIKYHGDDWNYKFDVNGDGIDFSVAVYGKKFMKGLENE
ncbi:MAG TPA: hypothetical protein DEG69_20445 [Flavobacteriaceae bacterium]|nr:hypothetical protein [Flavobacteriaceae bacterium]